MPGKPKPATKSKPRSQRVPAAKSATSAAKPVKTSKPVQIKTRPNDASVEAFLNAVPEAQKRKDSFVILNMMKKASGEAPKMWGSSLIGFGNVRLKSPATGREVDWLRIGFAPRKANLSLYITGDIQKHAVALKKLGKHKTGVGCLYINRLEDVDLKVLEGMIAASLKTGFTGKV
ncbi:MAG: DUF1801 domain-containing protein [Candidatus Thermoplasmatota archaeon]